MLELGLAVLLTEIVITFDSGQYQEISLTDWMAASPPHLLANNFGVPAETFRDFPKRSGFIRSPT